MTLQGTSPSTTQVVFGILNGLVNVFSGGGLNPVQQGLRGSPRVIFQNAAQLSTILGQMGVLNQKIADTTAVLPTIWNGSTQNAASQYLMTINDCFGQARQHGLQLQAAITNTGQAYQNAMHEMTHAVGRDNVVVGQLAANPIGGQVMATAAANASALSTMAKLSVLWRFMRAGGQAMMAIGELTRKTGANDNLFQGGRALDGLGDAGGTITRTVIPALGNLFGSPPAPTPPAAPPVTPPGVPVPLGAGPLPPTVADPNYLAQLIAAQQQHAAQQQYAAQQQAALLAQQQYTAMPGPGSGWIPQTLTGVTADLASPTATGGAANTGDDRVTVTVGDFDNDGDSEVRFDLPKERLNSDLTIDVNMTVDGKEVKGRLDVDAG